MLGQIVVEVKGMGNGIVMHNPDCMTKLPDGKGVDYKSKEYQDASFKYSQYRDKDDNLYQPSDHFMGAMVKAGARFKFEGKLSYAGVIEGGIIIEPDQILHKKGTKVEPFAKWVVVPPHDKKGARV